MDSRTIDFGTIYSVSLVVELADMASFQNLLACLSEASRFLTVKLSLRKTCAYCFSLDCLGNPLSSDLDYHDDCLPMLSSI
jgi:hypothetical protein